MLQGKPPSTNTKNVSMVIIADLCQQVVAASAVYAPTSISTSIPTSSLSYCSSHPSIHSKKKKSSHANRKCGALSPLYHDLAQTDLKYAKNLTTLPEALLHCDCETLKRQWLLSLPEALFHSLHLITSPTLLFWGLLLYCLIVFFPFHVPFTISLLFSTALYPKSVTPECLAAFQLF